MKGGAHQPGTDWEGLRASWTVEDLTDSPILPPGSEKIELWRDEQYGIEAKILGTLYDPTAELLPESGELGVIMPNHRIEGTSHSGIFRYELEHCSVRRASRSSQGILEADLKTSRVRRSTTSERGAQESLIEWYLNAHKGNLLYPRTVRRERKETYRKKTSYPDEETTIEGGGSLTVGGYAYIETPDLSFVLEHAPEETPRAGPRTTPSNTGKSGAGCRTLVLGLASLTW